jgi:hypothetical protein
MTRELACPRCRTPFPYDESIRGRQMPCRQCGLIFAVSPWDPAQAPDPAAPRTAEPAVAVKAAAPRRLDSRVLFLIVAGVGLVLVLFVGVPVVGFLLLPMLAGTAEHPAYTSQNMLDDPDDPDQQPPGFAAVPGVLRMGNPGADPAPAPAADPPADAVAEAVQQLQDADAGTQKRGADALARMDPEPERRAEVVQALKDVMASRDPFAPRQECVRALGVWATRREVNYLLSMLDHPQAGVRREAIKALGNLKAGRAAPELARRLDNASERSVAAEALKQIGAPAEQPVREQLRHANAAVRVEVCRILQAIGTEDSYPALKKAVDDPDGRVAQAAREALPADQRPREYGADETITVAVHVPNATQWPALEGRIRSLAEFHHATAKVSTSGAWKWVKVAPVRSEPATFARRITFGKVTAVHRDERLIYVESEQR